MAEYQEVVKQYKRMCESYVDVCDGCPLQNSRGTHSCRTWCFEEPVKAEELLMQWAKEHPVITNRQKFEEIFGFDISEKISLNMPSMNWVFEEYKEPKKDE